MAATKRTSSAHSGATLLEVLIAILIFSVALIGLIGIQGVAVQNTTSAKYRATASYLADQIVGQIWADRTNIANYNHKPGGGGCAPTGAASANGNVLAWLTAVQAALPGATAANQQIVIGANNVVTVAICWQAPGDTAQHNFTEMAQING
jgi:type IV pilus assembly protein PilV